MKREEFTKNTFIRDNHTCIVPGCNIATTLDAHHITERKLWLKDDPYPEGYHLANGASLCEKHHIAAEAGYFPPQAIRRWLDLPILLPQQLDKNCLWDKWGKKIERSTIEKYPRTPYFNFSQSQDPEDGCIDNSDLLNKPLVVTVKLDGSNVKLTREKVAARNGQQATHPSFDYLKSLHAGFRFNIPENLQLFGEWLLARHSIVYSGKMALRSYLQIFAIYEPEHQLFLGWNEVKEFCEENGFTIVPELGRVEYDAEWKMITGINSFYEKVIKSGHEGIVVKSTYPFHFSQHAINAAKGVRSGFITGEHWSQQSIVKNELE